MSGLDGFTHALLEAAPDAVLVADATGVVVLVNFETERLLGTRREELLGRELASLLSPPGPEGHPLAPRASCRTLDLLAHRRLGPPVPVEASLAAVGVQDRAYTMVVLHDLTERRRLEADLRHASTHDALTGLANRAAFDAALSSLEARGPHPVGVLMLDLDDLKRVNDVQGHAAGDALIRRAADVLRGTFRASDVVARIGGDEFAVLTAGRDAGAVERLVDRLHEALASHNQGQPQAPLRLSVGVAVAAAGTPLAAAVLEADARMYLMKRAHHRVGA